MTPPNVAYCQHSDVCRGFCVLWSAACKCCKSKCVWAAGVWSWIQDSIVTCKVSIKVLFSLNYIYLFYTKYNIQPWYPCYSHETCACALILFFYLICRVRLSAFKILDSFLMQMMQPRQWTPAMTILLLDKESVIPTLLVSPKPTYQFINQPASEAAMGYMRTR